MALVGPVARAARERSPVLEGRAQPSQPWQASPAAASRWAAPSRRAGQAHRQRRLDTEPTVGLPGSVERGSLPRLRPLRAAPGGELSGGTGSTRSPGCRRDSARGEYYQRRALGEQPTDQAGRGSSRCSPAIHHEKAAPCRDVDSEPAPAGSLAVRSPPARPQSPRPGSGRTDAKSAKALPDGKAEPASDTTAAARRLLPTPPGPTRVTSRASSSAASPRRVPPPGRQSWSGCAAACKSVPLA